MIFTLGKTDGMRWFSQLIISLVIALLLLGVFATCQPQETAREHNAPTLKNDTLAAEPAGQPQGPDDDREV